MNKYLTKIAQISTMTLQKVHGDSSTSVPGTPGVEGVPVPKRPDLTKVALSMNNEHMKDLRDTAVIGGLGGAVGIGAHRILSNMKNPGKAAVFGISTGLGLAADYAGLKINKGLDHLMGHSSTTKETNVPL